MATNISAGQLKKAKPENLIRLARFLRLNIEGMKHGQIARLVRWRITREIHRFNDAAKKAAYQALWEKM